MENIKWLSQYVEDIHLGAYGTRAD